jgi:putative sigma-54 modulation protein
MNITVTGRHIDVTGNLKNYTIEKVKKIEKYIGTAMEASVTMDVEKYRHKVDVLLRVNGVMIQAESVTDEMYTSIDEVMDKLERRVKKYKNKFLSQRKREERFPEAPIDEEEVPTIIKEKPFYVKPMSPEEAAMQLDLLDRLFLVFTNASTQEINVIHKRSDGHYGLIEALK